MDAHIYSPRSQHDEVHPVYILENRIHPDNRLKAIRLQGSGHSWMLGYAILYNIRKLLTYAHVGHSERLPRERGSSSTAPDLFLQS